MTIQLDRQAPDGASCAGRASGRRRLAGSAVAAAVLATSGIGAAVLFSGGDTSVRQPQPVLGRSLQPLAVHRVVPRNPRHAGAGDRLVPDIGRPGRTVRLRATPTIRLHVRYARVRPVAGHWLIEFTAPVGGGFDLASTTGKLYDVLIAGGATPLLFVEGSSDGTDFSIGAGPTFMTRAEALALARSLTTSVTVARCSPSAVEANECA